MSGLEIRFLGDFVVKLGGEPITALNKPRLQSLLAYLILHSDAPQFRYYLASMLWPDSPETQAHTNLRQLVFQLRQALPQVDQLIYTDNQTLQWKPEIPYILDLFEFKQLSLRDSFQNLPLENLETAVQLYQGDLLPSCYDEWVAVEREQVRQSFVAVLDQLIERYESQRCYAEAIVSCRRLVAVEPFHQEGYPRMMRLLALNGEAPSALKTYQNYTRLLKRELAIEPPAEMQKMAVLIKRNLSQAQSMVGEQVGRPAPVPLVGRVAEWQAIRALWKTAGAGNPRMLLICGEAGIGKTRLLEEFIGWAGRQGIRTAVAHCYASEGALPYAPVVEWLRTSRLPPLDQVWLTELSRLLPELLKGESNAPARLSEAWQRLRLFEALARGVLGEQQKSLLVIEDLHWCDQDTLEWLHYLLRFNPRGPFLVIGTVRSEEITVNQAYDNLLSVLRQEGNALEIDLKPLDEQETGQLATEVAGKALEKGIGSLLYHETEGNPLFIVETVRVEMFKQTHIPGVQSLPFKAHAVLEHRIHQLSPDTQEIVRLAATIGRAFSLEVLRQASGAADTGLIKSLDELLQRKIIREVAQNTFDFSHDKLRDAAFSGVSGVRRQLLHRKVAETLVNLADNELDRKSGEIASHYEQAGCPELAIQYYRIAAELARKIFANELVIQYDQRMIALGEKYLPGSAFQILPPDQLALLYENMGEVLAQVGKYPQAQAAFEGALDQPFAPRGLWRAQVYRKISQAWIPQNRYPQAHKALDLAETALYLSTGGDELPDWQEWIQIQLVRSDIYYWDRRPDQMDGIIQKILPLVEVKGRPDQQIELLNQQLMARFRHERYRLSDSTVEIAWRWLALVNQLKVPSDMALAQFRMGFTLLWHGEPLAARDWLVPAYEAAGRMGMGLLQVRSLTFLSIAYRQIGDDQSLRDRCSHLFEMALAIGYPDYQGISQANQGWLAWRDGDFASAERLCHSAYTLWNQIGGNGFHWLADWVLLAIDVSRRDLRMAERHARALFDPSPHFQPLIDTIALKLNEALHVCQLQNEETALQCLSQVLELVKTTGDL